MDMTPRIEQAKAAAQRLKPERRNLTADLIAGLTFAVVNVPQAMAHALLAMVNPVLGIYTLMLAVPIGAIFSSSVFMNVSSTAASSFLLFASWSRNIAEALLSVPVKNRIRLLSNWSCTSGATRSGSTCTSPFFSNVRQVRPPNAAMY